MDPENMDEILKKLLEVFFKTVIRIAAKINLQPIYPNRERVSFPMRNPNNAANTGSRVKIIAAVVALDKMSSREFKVNKNITVNSRSIKLLLN